MPTPVRSSLKVPVTQRMRPDFDRSRCQGPQSSIMRFGGLMGCHAPRSRSRPTRRPCLALCVVQPLRPLPPAEAAPRGGAGARRRRIGGHASIRHSLRVPGAPLGAVQPPGVACHAQQCLSTAAGVTGEVGSVHSTAPKLGWRGDILVTFQTPSSLRHT